MVETMIIEPYTASNLDYVGTTIYYFLQYIYSRNKKEPLRKYHKAGRSSLSTKTRVGKTDGAW